MLNRQAQQRWLIKTAPGGSELASEKSPSSSSGLVNEPSFTLKPRKTALVVVDMQYASASRTEGMGKKLASEGNEGLAGWRFDRIEELVIRCARNGFGCSV